MDKPQLHQSHIAMLARCGEQYRRRYRCGDRCPPGIAAHVGSGNHAAHSLDMNKVLTTGSLASLEETADAAVRCLDARWDADGVLLFGDDLKRPESAVRGDAKDLTVKLNEVRHGVLAPAIKPTRVSQKWVAELEGYPYDLAGEMDVEAEDGLHDLKTTGRWPESDAANSSLQLTVYTLARHFCDGIALPQDVHLDFVCGVKYKTKLSTGVKRQKSVRTQEHIDAFLARLGRVFEVLDKDVFLPTDPSNWWCNPRWCGYYPTCPYVKGRVQVGYEGED
jgi:hypothetical protein